MKEILGVLYDSYKIPVGSKIKFYGEKNKYTVKASNIMFTICTKGKLYTIIDWYNNIRGPENLIFGIGTGTKEDCEDMLDRLTQGESQVSYRNKKNLDLEDIIWSNL